MKYLKIYENFENNDIVEEVVYSLLDILDEYEVDEVICESKDSYLDDKNKMLYTTFLPTDTNFKLPNKFYRKASKNNTNYLVLYSESMVTKFGTAIEKALVRLNGLYNVKMIKSNELSVCNVLFVDQHLNRLHGGRMDRTMMCRTWIIEIME